MKKRGPYKHDEDTTLAAIDVTSNEFVGLLEACREIHGRGVYADKSRQVEAVEKLLPLDDPRLIAAVLSYFVYYYEEGLEREEAIEGLFAGLKGGSRGETSGGA